MPLQLLILYISQWPVEIRTQPSPSTLISAVLNINCSSALHCVLTKSSEAVNFVWIQWFGESVSEVVVTSTVMYLNLVRDYFVLNIMV